MPFMILIAVILLLAIVATVLIGEAGFTRLRLANIADSALISATSAFCRSLNQIVQLGQTLAVNQFSLQTHLLSVEQKCLCPIPPGNTMIMWGWSVVGGPYADGFVITTMMTNQKITEQIDKIAEDAAKDLRVDLYGRSFGSGLVDEPKPFLEVGDNWHPQDAEPVYDPALDCNAEGVSDARCDEVDKDRDGKVKALNFTRYAKRDDRLTGELRKFKKGLPPYSSESPGPVEGSEPPSGFIDIPYCDWDPAILDPYDPNLDCNKPNPTDCRCDEVKHSPEPNGDIVAIHYKRYTRRVGYAPPAPVTGGDKWYTHPVISYSFNRSNQGYQEHKGILTDEPVINSDYSSYLRTELVDVPTEVNVSYAFRPLIYFWLKPSPYTTGVPPVPQCACVPIPLMIPNPWAGISSINTDSNIFGVSLGKRAHFKEGFPFFGREMILEHANRINVKGSTRRGYDFQMLE